MRRAGLSNETQQDMPHAGGRGDRHAVTPRLEDIQARLDNVFDPELDESIIKLGFVDDVQIDGGTVTVVYKLPTFWCAPNFAYMMSSDVREEVLQAPGVRDVRVVLLDHCADEEINAGVNRGLSFQQTFPDDSLDDLQELRRKFLDKSFLARKEQLIRRMRQAGLSDTQIIGLRVGDAAPHGEDVVVHQNQEPRTENQDADLAAHGSQFSVLGSYLVRLAAPDLAKYLRKRAGLGLPGDVDALLFTMRDGAPLQADTLADYLRRSRTVRLSIAFNSSLCEGLLRARYQPERIADTTSVGDTLLASL
jgi:metal-sulfur cluster biosynthetic enzyme